jgi:hypothetical protein
VANAVYAAAQVSANGAMEKVNGSFELPVPLRLWMKLPKCRGGARVSESSAEHSWGADMHAMG